MKTTVEYLRSMEMKINELIIRHYIKMFNLGLVFQFKTINAVWFAFIAIYLHIFCLTQDLQ